MSEQLAGDELDGHNATLVWDGLGAVQLRYHEGWLRHKDPLTNDLLKVMGERTVPVEALRGVELTLPAAGDPQLRLLVRPGADPLIEVAGGELTEKFDPYRFNYRPEQELLAEYYAQEIQTSINLHQVGDGPAGNFLIAAPPAPGEVKGNDGKVSLDGDRLIFKWSWAVQDSKRTTGKVREIPLAEIAAVRWRSASWGAHGYLWVGLKGEPEPEIDAARTPNTLWLDAFSQAPALPFAANLLAKTRTP